MTRVALFALALALCAQSVAFPPAPGVVVYGIARSKDGAAIDGPHSYIVFKSGGVELARRTLRFDADSNENYRLLLPLDMSSGVDAYRFGVFDAAVPFTVEIEIGDVVFYPIESLSGLHLPGAPAGVVRFDFSLGVDSDGDTLPDEWELWQLQRGGIGPESPEYGLQLLYADGDFDKDGMSDRDEYIAGTFAFVAVDRLVLDIVDFAADGTLTFEFVAVIGKSYRFEKSLNLSDWLPVEVTIEGNEVFPKTRYDAPDTRVMNVKVSPSQGTAAYFYRIVVEQSL